MKNIHVLPTDKPSRLIIYSTLSNEFRLLDKPIKNWKHKRHAYITNDEDIKEGDWVYNIASKTKFKATKGLIDLINDPNVTLTTNKKIILTTDTDLIKEGIQAIDDEFLEWFVKNPSCVSIETIITNEVTVLVHNAKPYYEIQIPKDINITKCGNKNCQSGVINGLNPKICKKCNPKKESKQEIVEEVSKSEAFEFTVDYKPFETDLGYREYAKYGFEKGFIKGAKWQQKQNNLRLKHSETLLSNCEKTLEKNIQKEKERRYSEEEVEKIITILMHDLHSGDITYGDDIIEFKISPRKWFNQFKEKQNKQ